jgi:hypothetical protein
MDRATQSAAYAGFVIVIVAVTIAAALGWIH